MLYVRRSARTGPGDGVPASQRMRSPVERVGQKQSQCVNAVLQALRQCSEA